METNNPQVVRKIVVTGGPGAGKSTFLNVVTQWLEDRGWSVLIAPEAATELIVAGITPWGNWKDGIDFQNLNLKQTLNYESLFIEAAGALDTGKPSVILFDRGIMDAEAYVGKEEFNKILDRESLSRNEALDRYNGVVFLHSAAEGVESAYTLENNEARTETPEQARDINRKTLDAWMGHQHLQIVKSDDSFEHKIENAKRAVAHILGIPEPIEIERKFLVRSGGELPQDAVKVSIRQDYLEIEGEGERRVRKRVVEGSTRPSYFYTEKREISPGKRFEKESSISEREYIALLDEVDVEYRPIFKTRHCFVRNDQYLELDVFEKQHEGLWILEIELTETNTKVTVPPFLTYVGEVTGNRRFSNRELARIK